MESYYEIASDNLDIEGYPIECFELLDCKAGTFASAHWHSYAEIIYVTEGEYQVIVNGESCHLHEGELIYIVPGQIHTTICPDKEHVCLIVLKFDTKLLLSLSEWQLEKNVLSSFMERSVFAYVIFQKEQMDKVQMEEILRSVLAELRMKETGYLLMVRNIICDLTLKLLRNCGELLSENCKRQAYRTENRDEFYPVLTYIENNYDKEIKIEDLLGMQHLSYSNFAIKFKRYTGESIITYLNKFRIKQAQKLLREPGLPVNEVATKCGFMDICYFCRVFRKYCGQSPREFRKSLQVT